MDDFETRKASLISEYAQLINKGLPSDQTERLWNKVAELPDEHQAEFREVAKTAEALKRVLDPRSR